MPSIFDGHILNHFSSNTNRKHLGYLGGICKIKKGEFMYELIFIQGQTLKNRGKCSLIAIGEDYDQLFQIMKDDLKRKGIVSPYFRIITKENRTIIDYGSYTSKYIIKENRWL